MGAQNPMLHLKGLSGSWLIHPYIALPYTSILVGIESALEPTTNGMPAIHGVIRDR